MSTGAYAGSASKAGQGKKASSPTTTHTLLAAEHEQRRVDVLQVMLGGAMALRVLQQHWRLRASAALHRWSKLSALSALHTRIDATEMAREAVLDAARGAADFYF